MEGSLRTEQEKKDRRNMLRRERRQGIRVDQLRSEARDTLQEARNTARLLVEEARSRVVEAEVRIQESQRKLEELSRLILQRTADLHFADVGFQERTNTRRNSPSAALDPDQLMAKRVAAAERQRRCRRRKKEQESRECLNLGNDTSNRSGRRARDIAARLVKSFHDFTKSHNLVSQKKVLQRFWLHKSLKKVHPARYGGTKEDVSVASGFRSVQQALQAVKGAKRKDHLAAKHTILTALVGNEVVARRYQSSLARALGVKRDNMARAGKRRALIDGDATIRYPLGERKTRSDKLSEVIRNDVEWYWQSYTRASPNKKDNAKKRLGPKLREVHRVHWLEETEVEFFLGFKSWLEKEQKPYTLGLRSFQALKPYYIRTMKDRNVCCCKAHVEIDLLKQAFNKFRQAHPVDCNCQCMICRPCGMVEPDSSSSGPQAQRGCRVSDVPPRRIFCDYCLANPLSGCKAYKSTYQSVREWCNTTLCPKPQTRQWHKRKCLMGNCSSCGVEKLPLCDLERDSASELCKEMVQWETYEYVILDDLPKPRGGRKRSAKVDSQGNAKKVKRLRVARRVTTFKEFKEKIQKTIPEFVRHNFRARWQGEQYLNCLKTFPKGTVVSSIDFAENYTFKVQDEIQSLHWDNRQLTILVHITYRHLKDAGEEDLSDEEEETDRHIVADYHFYVSDDNTHDTLFVQHCLDLHWRWMMQQGIRVEKHIMWSDGCAAQFKSCRPFFFVSRYFQEYGARMQWCFHASGHGKGVQDGLGGGVKHALEKEQLKGVKGAKLDDAHDAVLFLREHFKLGKEMEYEKKQHIRRFFHEILIDEVDRADARDCHPLTGTRSLHNFLGYSPENPLSLATRDLSCFCAPCIDDKWQKCENTRMVKDWKLETVVPKQAAKYSEIMRSLGPGCGHGDLDLGLEEEECLGDLLQIGDLFAVEAKQPNEWDVEFYILQCERTAHELTKDLTDAYNAKFGAGDRVVRGIWFQPYGKKASCFVLNQEAPLSYVDVATVRHMKFFLLPTGKNKGSSSFTLPPETLDSILNSLERANPTLEDINLSKDS